MQKWEYIVVRDGDVYVEQRVGKETQKVYQGTKAQYVNGKELPNWASGPDLYVYLNQLGEQGWELVSTPYTEIAYGWNGSMHGTSSEVHRISMRFVFKRPKQ